MLFSRISSEMASGIEKPRPFWAAGRVATTTIRKGFGEQYERCGLGLAESPGRAQPLRTGDVAPAVCAVAYLCR
jgi:hypothetical protein